MENFIIKCLNRIDIYAIKAKINKVQEKVVQSRMNKEVEKWQL